jgi:coproporphyrinogen III oxidase-like Fe-S oxidoreductase
MTLDTTGSTEVGSYFISNYPPYSTWKEDFVPEALNALDSEPDSSIPMGLYIHIPFCRKRCKFCYFRVYTKQNAQDVENYVSTLEKEFELLSQKKGVINRKLEFAYFGGGTPSYLSSKQLLSLHDRLSEYLNWESAKEVTYECEPGTLNFEKVKTLKQIGVTRISLGVENFNPKILEANGRAHLADEVFRAWDWIQQVGFPQVNIDLIAGMIGENDENWTECLEKIQELSPDNITIYQMELPHNTIISQEIKELGIDSPIANWATKRAWMNQAIDTLESGGYHLCSGNELVKNLDTDHFIYRDNLFRGSDILATGVSSFGHFQGIHYQNYDRLDEYMERIQQGELAINRALRPTEHQKLVREMILQMKEGKIFADTFQEKFQVNILEEFSEQFHNQEKAGYLTIEGDLIKLTRRGILQAESLLPEYFEEQFREVRYT